MGPKCGGWADVYLLVRCQHIDDIQVEYIERRGSRGTSQGTLT